MITAEEATRLVLENAMRLKDTILPLEAAIGGYLREDLYADRDLPPYDRVTMDGIAIRYEQFALGRRTFPVAGAGAAGQPQIQLPAPDQCVEIMTGAILPRGADTIIRYEDVEIQSGQASLKSEAIKQGQNIHRQGIDRRRGDRVVRAGRPLSPAEIGLAATVGKTQLRVAHLPECVIISSGDELVDIHESPAPHQIRKSNVHRLRATLRAWGLPADTAHLPDEPETIRQRLGQLLERYPLILISGGGSTGKCDYLPQALEELGVEKRFHRVRQRPGKPFWFGRHARGNTVFALPGNPVSSFMCTRRYFYPWLQQSLGVDPLPRAHAILTEDVTFKPDLTYFLQVRLQHQSDGTTHAQPVAGHGSGDLANLVDADAFLELPAGRDVYAKGKAFRVWTYR